MQARRALLGLFFQYSSYPKTPKMKFQTSSFPIYFRASSAFGARAAPGINSYRMGKFSRGPVPNASKRQFGSANLGSPGLLFGTATQGSQSESCLGGWWCEDPGEEVDRRRLGRTASRQTSKPSGRSRAKAKHRSGSHSELLSRVDGIE